MMLWRIIIEGVYAHSFPPSFSHPSREEIWPGVAYSERRH